MRVDSVSSIHQVPSCHMHAELRSSTKLLTCRATPTRCSSGELC